MKVLIVQPPRKYWPYISEGDNFLLPQGPPALAAPLKVAGHDVQIIDCLPLHLGWRSLEELLVRLDPDIVGCGESHAIYASEALKLFRLCKERIPRAKTVAGGGHFTNLWHRYAVPKGDIDAVVIGEGEITFLDLVNEYSNDNPDLSKVLGIAWSDGEKTIINKPRPLVENLDSLPLPAYELMPMHLYGKSRYLFSPQGTTIQHSRGCTSQCEFCCWWTTFADRKLTDEQKLIATSRWRTKSPERSFEEMELLYKKFGKRSYVWVDGSWNLSPEFSDRFADLVIHSDLKPIWFAFFRADAVIRDEQLGILEKLVAAGLSHVLIGLERAEDSTLKSFNKRFYQGGVAERAVKIFTTKYPQVFVQGTFIVGVKEESKESLAAQLKMARSLNIDFPAFHPITPVPGTPIYDKAIKEGQISESQFDDFDWLTPVMDSDYLTKDEIAEIMYDMNEVFVNPKWLLKGLFNKVPYKRDMYKWFAIVSARMAIKAATDRLNPFSAANYQKLIEPPWYNS